MRTFTILLILLFPFIAFSQLSKGADYFKQSQPKVYNTIKDHAVKKWDNNHEMIVHQINDQCDSILKLFTTLKNNMDVALLNEMILKWTYEGHKDSVSKVIGSPGVKITDLLPLAVNWEMVNYEYEKQVKAKASY